MRQQPSEIQNAYLRMAEKGITRDSVGSRWERRAISRGKYAFVRSEALSEAGHNKSMALKIPAGLATSCRKSVERTKWLASLPDLLQELERRWSLTLGAAFDSEDVSCSFVAKIVRADGTPAVLKIGMPHMEADHEIQGLRFWGGDPTVRLLEADDTYGAMLLERCEPGVPLRTLPEEDQDVVIASLLSRLWRKPAAPHSFRPLSALLEHWSNETLACVDRWPDAGLVREGLRLFQELSRNTLSDVLLATDLHAGNVLRAQREPWLVIDPKPFVGDPAYDATQHLFNCFERMRADAEGTIRRLADLLGVDHERVRLWTFARAAADPRDDWNNIGRLELARALAP
jgi:streptomycin 6-kinase